MQEPRHLVGVLQEAWPEPEPGPLVPDDLIERDFTAADPNKLWLRDITSIHCRGHAHVCAVKDVFTGRIVGFSMDSLMKAPLAVAAPEEAVRGHLPVRTVVHSDRGSQFRSRRFVEALRHHGPTGSMGTVGAYADNAAMESFFSLLQKNVLDRQRWNTRQELRLAITTWIERIYHHLRRRQKRLGKLTPIEYETSNRMRSQRPKTPSQQKAGAVPNGWRHCRRRPR